MTLPTNRQDIWKPATEADKTQALAALGSLPSRATSSGSLDKAAYHMALDGVTRHGLVKAVEAILKNALGHPFFPSPPELRGQCDKAMDWHRQEARRAQRRSDQSRLNADLDASHEAKTADARAKVRSAYQRFIARYDQSKIEDQEAARAAIRARYGMTPEVLASIPNASDDKRAGRLGGGDA